MAFEDLGETFDSDADIIFTFLGKSQAQAVRSFAVDVKWLADYIGHACLRQADIKKLFAILILRQSDPQKQSALRLSPMNGVRHELLQRFQHYLTSRVIELANFRQMRLDNPSLPAF